MVNGFPRFTYRGSDYCILSIPKERNGKYQTTTRGENSPNLREGFLVFKNMLEYILSND